jgi:DNA-binding beta-propeller fold protein YncE
LKQKANVKTRFLRITWWLGAVLSWTALFAGPSAASAAYGDTSTYLSTFYGGDGLPALSAYFDFPEDLDFLSDGSMVIADTQNQVIRKVNAGDSVTSTLAGSGIYGAADGAAAAARFAQPKGVAVGPDDAVYVADTMNSSIRKVAGGAVTTVVSSGLKNPEGLAYAGGNLYIADTGDNALKKVPAAGGSLTTVATGLNGPKKVAVTADQKTAYVADAGSHRVLAVDIASGAVTVLAGSGSDAYAEGSGTGASFQNNWGVALSGSTLYVTDGDGYSDKIRSIDTATGATALFANDLKMRVINYPAGMRVRGNYVYVANSGIGTVQRFTLDGSGDSGGEKVVGKNRFNNEDGAAATVLLGRPRALVESADGKTLYVAVNNNIRTVDRATGYTAPLVGDVIDDYIGESALGSEARFSFIAGLAINRAGTTLYLADHWSNRIRSVDILARSTALVAGSGRFNDSGPGNGYVEGARDVANFSIPSDVALDPTEQYLYVTDTGNHRIRKVRIADGQTELVAGSGVAGFADGVGPAAKFKNPWGLALNSTGTVLYVADRDNHRIRAIDLATKKVTTVAGTGTAGDTDALGVYASFSLPRYLALKDDAYLFVSSAGSHSIRVVELGNSNVTKLVAGSGSVGWADGGRTAATFNDPGGIAVDADGATLLLADTRNDMLRAVDIRGVAPFTSSGPTLTAVLPGQLKSSATKGTTLSARGKNFQHGSVAYLGSHKLTTFVESATKLGLRLPAGGLAPGIYEAQVLHRDGQRSTLKRAFKVSDSAGNVPSTTFRAGGGVTYTPTISPKSGGAGQTADGQAALVVPAGGVSEKVAAVAAKVTSPRASVFGRKAVGPAYRFRVVNAKGKAVRLKKSITLRLRYPVATKTDALALYWYDAKLREWKPLTTTLDLYRRIASAKTKSADIIVRLFKTK